MYLLKGRQSCQQLWMEMDDKQAGSICFGEKGERDNGI